MTPISSSRPRADVVRLLLVYTGLALLLIGARSQSGVLSHAEMIDGALPRACSMMAALAPAGQSTDLPSMLAPLVGAADRSTDDDDDDDDDDAGHESPAAGRSRDTSASLNGRLAGIDPAHSRDFDNLPRRAPPL